MRDLHWFLQRPRGCGKTALAWLLAQYLPWKIPCARVQVIECAASELQGFPALQVETVTPGPGEIISSSLLDRVDDALQGGPAEVPAIVDCGGMVDFDLQCRYLRGMQDIWQQGGIQLYVHAPLCGRPLWESTCCGIRELSDLFPGHLIVWINEQFSGIKIANNLLTEQLRYLHMAGLVAIPPLKGYQNGMLCELLCNGWCFDDVLPRPEGGNEELHFSRGNWRRRMTRMDRVRVMGIRGRWFRAIRQSWNYPPEDLQLLKQRLQAEERQCLQHELQLFRQAYERALEIDRECKQAEMLKQLALGG